MVKVVYRIVQHDDGWAYKVGDVFSEPFRTRDAAINAARRAAGEQRVAGETAGITWEDGNGRWHEEVAEGTDRPDTEVEE